jgi:hypothetical protein
MSAATDAIEQCDRILEKCDEVPEEGIDFAESIRGKVRSMRTWIWNNGHVTDKQQTSLDNMESGVDRWLEHEEE